MCVSEFLRIFLLWRRSTSRGYVSFRVCVRELVSFLRDGDRAGTGRFVGEAGHISTTTERERKRESVSGM